MEILDRYLQAVKFWLPSTQQEDIVTELREDIRSEIEERETELGRPLNDNELEALLKQRGRPLLVAEKYLPQRSLIGPVLFPAYWFVLKIALLCYLVPWIAVWIALVVFSPEYRAHHLGLAALKDFFVLWLNGWVAFTVPTIVFAILERLKNQDWLAKDWSPRKLPRVRDTQHISRPNSGFELIFGVIFGIWWLKILWTLTVFDAGGVKITLSPGWHKFFWAFLLLAIVNTTLSAVNFVRPYWTRLRRGVRAASNFATAIVLLLVVNGFTPIMAQGPAIPGDKSAVVSWSVNFGLTLSFAIAIVVCLALAVVDAWRAFKIERTQLNHRLAV
jgi:hypothetical protein